MTDAIYGCDGCRTTIGRAGCPTHRDNATYTPPPGGSMAGVVFHRHAWRYDGVDGPHYLYHCDDHDPPVIRRVWHTDAEIDR